jgi:hypothetical protein
LALAISLNTRMDPQEDFWISKAFALPEPGSPASLSAACNKYPIIDCFTA